MVILNKSHISISVGVWEQISANVPVTWESNNSNVYVDKNGWVFATKNAFRTDNPSGQATITATSNGEVAICNITVVDWQTNKLMLEVVSQLPYTYFTLIDGIAYAAMGVQLFKTLDDYETIEYIGDLPAEPDYWSYPILSTPFGYFFRKLGKIYRSSDLVNWSLSYDSGTGIQGLTHSFDWYYKNETLYIYFGEYSTDATNRHKVYKGIITNKTEMWTTALNIYSRAEYNANPLITPSADHIHAVAVDKSNGNLYVGTGDTNDGCRIFLSEDYGTSFRIIGEGNQNWRLLSMWFTEDYIYWNMDTSSVAQCIWRIAKSNLATQSPINDQKEKVADLIGGAHWYHFWAVDDNGNDVVIMNSSAEGQLRDWRGLIFSIKEDTDGSVSIQELFSVPSDTPESYVWRTQLRAFFQLGDYLYFRGWGTEHNAMWKMRYIRQTPQERRTWCGNFNFKTSVFD